MPDLYGTIGYISSTSHSDVRGIGATGVFRWISYTPIAQVVSPGATSSNTYDIELYASRINPIFGRSNTVTPLSIRVQFYIKF